MKKILIVDDEQPICDVLQDLFDGIYEVALAANGKEAHAKLSGQKFDMVITDLVMPEMNGIDLITSMRKVSPDIKIIAISGGGGISGRFDYLPVAQLIGAEKIFRKPFELAKLKQTVRDMLD